MSLGIFVYSAYIGAQNQLSTQFSFCSQSFIMLLSRTQVLPQDIMHLYDRICDIREAGWNPGTQDINTLDNLMVSRNTPDPTWGTHGRDDLDYGETRYNKLPPGLPKDNPCTPSCHGCQNQHTCILKCCWGSQGIALWVSGLTLRELKDTLGI